MPTSLTIDKIDGKIVQYDDTFSIEIDFERGKGDPSRVFRAMSDLIDALKETDKDLVKSIDTKIEPVILLEDVETQSIKAWLRQVVDSIDDEGLKKGEYKIVVGKYLVKAKYLMIDFLNDKTDIQGTQEIEALEKDLLALAEETDVRMLPVYTPIPRIKLLKGLEKINNALAPLDENDNAKFVTKDDEVNFNLSLDIMPESIEHLITADVMETTGPMILKVKKPDFLGASQWEFRHGDSPVITAKITDEQWLTNFQQAKVIFKPGDALKAIVHQRVLYGFNREPIARHYTIERVDEVLPSPSETQNSLFNED